MAGMKVPTIEIVSINDPARKMVINKSQYDEMPDYYTLWKDRDKSQAAEKKEAPPKKGRPKKGRPAKKKAPIKAAAKKTPEPDTGNELPAGSVDEILDEPVKEGLEAIFTDEEEKPQDENPEDKEK